MLKEDNFSWFFPLGLALILNHLIVLRQLYFIGLDHLCDLWLLRFLEAWEHLYEIDGDPKHILRGRDDLFVLFGIIFKLSFEVDFPAIQVILIFLESD